MATPVARSFLQVAETEEVASPLRVVQIEGLVTLHDSRLFSVLLLVNFWRTMDA
ncbi:hypothetical protein ACE6H2_026035 [Prunus campanulata]